MHTCAFKTQTIMLLTVYIHRYLLMAFQKRIFIVFILGILQLDKSRHTDLTIRSQMSSATNDEVARFVEATVKQNEHECSDYLGFDILRSKPQAIVYSSSVIMYIAGAAALGALLQYNYEDKVSYNYFKTAARVFGFVNLGLLLVIMFTTRLGAKSIAPWFKRATLDPIYSNDGQLQIGVGFGLLHEYKSNIRRFAVIGQLILCVLYLVFWFEIEDQTEPEATYVLVENIGSVRNFLFLWMVVVPSMSTGFIDWVHITSSNEAGDSLDKRIAGRHGRAIWTLLSISYRMLIYAVIIFLVDPYSELLFFHKENTTWERVSLICASILLAILLTLFWLRYHDSHVGKHDKSYAYMDFPVTLAFVVAYTWAYCARMRDHHGEPPASYDFFVFTFFLGAGTLGVINIPPATDFKQLHIDLDVSAGRSQRAYKMVGLTDNNEQQILAIEKPVVERHERRNLPKNVMFNVDI